MLYLNQLDYGHIPYQHNLDAGGVPPEKATCAVAGCGPCCLCMTVENLTIHKLELLDCLKLSNELGANRKPGTSLKIMSPVIAERYGLSYEFTDDVSVLREHLRSGGMAIANSGGDREDHVGLFTHGGHYISVVSIDSDDEVCILDPSYKEGKYEEEGRKGKVSLSYPFVYCSLETLKEDCLNRSPAYYLFKRKGPEKA